MHRADGQGVQASVLEYRLAGRNISEVLAMSVAEALALFGSGAAKTPAARAHLRTLMHHGPWPPCSRRPAG